MKAIGRFKFTVLDKSGLIIAEREAFNLITTEGADHIWDNTFGNVTTIDPWYIGLIRTVPTPALVIGDTLASHGSWIELIPGTDYTGNRQPWVESASASRIKTSSANAVFPILQTWTIYGAFLTDQATGTAGILMSEAAFAVALPVVNGNTVNVVYSIELAS